MKLHDLKPAKASRRPRKRIGRGPGSGTGKTAGRGHKGQRSRAGFSRRAGFEGGQMPLIRRVPKRGFTNIFRTEYTVINVGDLDGLGETIDVELLVSRGRVRRGMKLKVLGDGAAPSGVTVRAHRFSVSARAKIEAAGGVCEVIG